ncbi:MAG: aminotransferase class III-fold pyridoxal phosphate-dependent enzyme, partial [Clostridiales bacterium]|nr:aminotransferase class III-fold pyridoxal phosphate-dependent enzyme [Clostridiales bacterium]
LADYNSEASVEALFRANDDIAAIIVEPVAANMGVVPPKDGFLSFLRTICTEHGALLIFDEVITGFRLALGGASEYYGVTPDLVTLGKVVGGGMPLAAYGGRAELMDFIAPTGPVYQAGTLSGNPVATAAGLAQLTVLKEHPDLYGRLEEKAQVLEAAYREKGWNVNRAGSLLSVFFTDRPVENYDDALTCDTDLFARYFHHMLGRGIYLAPSQFEAIFVSAVHTADDLEQTVDAIRAFRE